MGYGDWLHWTSVIRDLYLDINNCETYEQKVNKIKQYIHNTKDNKSHIMDYKYESDDVPFKIKAKAPSNGREVCYNNPYMVDNFTYPNIVFFHIASVDYYEYNNFFDDQHIVDLYCQRLGLSNYSHKCEIHFTDAEHKKVLKYVPKEDFIFIHPINYQVGRSYPFEKFQNIVNALKDNIKFIQASPVHDKTRVLDNVSAYIDNFTYRETILFLKYAKLIVVNHGGISIGSNVVGTPVISIYNAMFHPRMTTYDNEMPVYIADNNHHECGIVILGKNKKKYADGCQQCIKLMEDHDEQTIIDLIKTKLS